MEQQVKTILGEYVFTIAALQSQVAQLEKEIKELKDGRESLTSNDS